MPGPIAGLEVQTEATEAQRARRSGATAFLLSSALSRVLVLAAVVYSARVLGPESFGLVAFASAAAMFLTALLTQGITIWGTRAVAEDRAAALDWLVRINGARLALALIAYAVLAAFAFALPTRDERLVVLAAGATMLAAASSVDWLGQGLERFGSVAIGQFIGGMVTLAGTVLFVRAPDHFVRVPLLVAAGHAAAAAIVLILLGQKGLLQKRRLPLHKLSATLRSAAPLGAAAALIAVLHHSNTVALQLFRGPEDVGSFAAAFRIFEILGYLPGLLAAVVLPRLTLAATSGQHQESARHFVRLVVSIGMLAATILALDAPAVIHTFYGERYAASSTVLQILAPAILFNYAAITYLTLLLAFKRDRRYLASNAAAAVVSIAGALLLVPRFGLLGATVTVATLDAINFAVSLPAVRASVGSMLLDEWRRPAYATLLAGGVLLTASWLGLPLIPRVSVTCVVFGLTTMRPEITALFALLSPARLARSA